MSLEVHGLRELQRDLRRLPGRIQGRVVRNATRAAAVVIRRKAKELAPSRTGKLRKGIIIRTGRGRDRHELRAVVGLHARAFYGSFHEFGTRFLSARPWLRPAFDSTKEDAADALRGRLWTEIRRFLK